RKALQLSNVVYESTIEEVSDQRVEDRSDDHAEKLADTDQVDEHEVQPLGNQQQEPIHGDERGELARGERLLERITCVEHVAGAEGRGVTRGRIDRVVKADVREESHQAQAEGGVHDADGAVLNQP